MCAQTAHLLAAIKKRCQYSRTAVYRRECKTWKCCQQLFKLVRIAATHTHTHTQTITRECVQYMCEPLLDTQVGVLLSKLCTIDKFVLAMRSWHSACCTHTHTHTHTHTYKQTQKHWADSFSLFPLRSLRCQEAKNVLAFYCQRQIEIFLQTFWNFPLHNCWTTGEQLDIKLCLYLMTI